MNNKLDCAILILPSVRSIAYLSMFKQLNVVPSEIILLKEGNNSKLDELKKEDGKYNYSKKYFDINLDINSYIKENNIKTNYLDTRDINSAEVVEALSNSTSEYVIFTGGGIAKKPILSLNKKYIHTHPGILPDFRGSTCFYYSVLAKNELGATSIILDENIDTGEIMSEGSFTINYKINADQPLFMDYVLDPFIRANTLKKLLEKFKTGEVINKKQQSELDKPAYYVMHPLLRHITINNINSNFNPKNPQGIIEQ